MRDGSRTLVVRADGLGQEPRLLDRDPRPARCQGHGPTLIVSPLLSLMRNQIEAADRLGPARRHDQLGQPRRLGLDRGRPRRGPDRRPVRVRAAVRERGLQRAAAAGDPPLDRDVRGGRGALHQRLGPRVRAGLPADRPAAAVARPGRPRAGDDGDGERPGGRGRGAASWATTSRSSAGPLARDTLHLDAIPLRDQAERLAWLAEQLPGDARHRDRLLPDGRRHAARLGLAARPGHRRPSVQRRHRARGARGARAATCSRTGSRRSSRRSRWGWASTSRTSASSSTTSARARRSPTTSRSAGRAAPSRTRTGSCSSGREDDAIAEYFMSTAFPPTARMQDILAALEGADSATIKNLQATVNLPYGQIEKALKLLEVDGAVAQGPRAASAGPASPGSRTRRGWRRCSRRGGASWRRCRSTSTRPRAGWRSSAGCSTTRPRASAATARTTAGVRWPRTVVAGDRPGRR